MDWALTPVLFSPVGSDAGVACGTIGGVIAMGFFGESSSFWAVVSSSASRDGSTDDSCVEAESAADFSARSSGGGGAVGVRTTSSGGDSGASAANSSLGTSELENDRSVSKATGAETLDMRRYRDLLA